MWSGDLTARAGHLQKASKPERGGKGGGMETGENQKQVSTASHPSLEISPKTRDSHFPTAPKTTVRVGKRKKQGGSRRLNRNPKADRSRVNKSGHLDKLTTGFRSPPPSLLILSF